MKEEISRIESQVEQQRVASNGEDGAISFAELLELYQPEQLRRGQVVEGKILLIEDHAIYADVGAKRTAIVPPQDLEQVQADIVDNLAVGDTVLLYVVQTPHGDDDLIVSLQRGLQQRDWQLAQTHLENETMLELDVVAQNKGGVLVLFEHLHGFVPDSHIPELYRIRDPRRRAAYKTRLVGSRLPVKIIEIDQERKRLVMSVKAAEKELRKKRLAELQVGETITGTVINIVDFGAFVDLGGVDGLIHISNLAWHQVDHPSKVVTVGDEVDVRVDKVDVERDRISLNRKVCLPNPWQQFAAQHQDGDLLEGVVTNVTDFGAFVLLPGDIEGLVHVSEMRIFGEGHPRDVLQTGDVVIVRLLSIDSEEQRVRLSQRRVTAAEEMDWMARKAPQPLPDDGEDPVEAAEMELAPEPETAAAVESHAQELPEPIAAD